MPSVTIYLPNHLYNKIKGNPSQKVQEALKLMFYVEEMQKISHTKIAKRKGGKYGIKKKV